ncbi:hypothetical protein T03_15753 [Trichinella britovi]|uniref:Uncharacterized protein n=1 Tax=Trichinella britovi TaxID=45882 RepID=A0A0V0Z2B4_TRIBR|nr:hypothetical protein T03_15753 [Trichinella britovi]
MAFTYCLLLFCFVPSVGLQQLLNARNERRERSTMLPIAT